MTSATSPRRARTPLSRATLIASATELADSEGLQAVTIRQLAHRHGVTAMAIYAHFDDKEALLDALGEALLDSVQVPDLTAGESRTNLGAVLTAFVDALRAHPAIAPITARRILECDSGIDLAEQLLAQLTALGHPIGLAAATSHYLLSGVVALVASEPGRSCVRHDIEGQEQLIRSRRARLLALAPERHPHVVAAATPLTMCANPDIYYAQGIELLVNGACALGRPR
ncbi:TetR/AcrR family transcriptional regulator [Salinispora arenicola]|uniref:TetR/AcrR family transcriptional regulator n=1 Tax=Salinispora arenicola TaxID=168697 RepID=UPI000361BC41|nr:TetR family transcriptional regulator [Salinispora arenicola]